MNVTREHTYIESRSIIKLIHTFFGVSVHEECQEMLAKSSIFATPLHSQMLRTTVLHTANHFSVDNAKQTATKCSVVSVMMSGSVFI